MNATPADPLSALRDIYLPPPPPFWPPAPGWWALAVLGSCVLVGLIWLVWRQRLRARRLARIEALLAAAVRAGETDSARLLVAVSELLRRVALRRYPRAEVAPLAGVEWLRFLDRTGGDGQFSTGVGTALAHGPYQATPAFDREALLRLARRWLRRNLR
ncbi:MAG: DUF4381 domain-containing protein [Thiotrichales bacterium]